MIWMNNGFKCGPVHVTKMLYFKVKYFLLSVIWHFFGTVGSQQKHKECKEMTEIIKQEGER